MINNIKKNDIDIFSRSPLIFRACEKIGQRLNLHLDQIGEIDALIRKVLRGLSEPKNFTSDIKRILEIDDSLAEKITAEANKEVFETIKKDMQSSETPVDSVDSTSLEQAGGFTIEKGAGQDSDESADTSGVKIGDKAKILNDIEFPASSVERVVQNDTEETFTEPLVDQLLAKPTSTAAVKPASAPANLPVGEVAPSVQPVVKTEPPKPKGPDVYREPIK